MSSENFQKHKSVCSWAENRRGWLSTLCSHIKGDFYCSNVTCPTFKWQQKWTEIKPKLT